MEVLHLCGGGRPSFVPLRFHIPCIRPLRAERQGAIYIVDRLISCLVLSLSCPCLVVSCLAVSCLVLSCLVLSCLVLSCLVLFCLVLSCFVLFCFFSSHLGLSYLVMSRVMLSFRVLHIDDVVYRGPLSLKCIIQHHATGGCHLWCLTRNRR